VKTGCKKLITTDSSNPLLDSKSSKILNQLC